MKKFVISSLLCIAYFFLTAQTGEKYLLKEDFADNFRKWNTGTEKHGNRIIKNGKYIIENTETGLEVFNIIKSTTFLQIDTSKDFSISISAKQLTGENKAIFGLTFSTVGSFDYMALLINQDGYYSLFSVVNLFQITPVINFTETDALKKGLNTENNISIRKEAGEWKIYINSVYISTIHTMLPSIYNVGAVVLGKSLVEFDDLIVK